MPPPTKWSNILKQFFGKSRQIVLSSFDHFVGWHLKRVKFCCNQATFKLLNSQFWFAMIFSILINELSKTNEVLEQMYSIDIWQAPNILIHQQNRKCLFLFCMKRVIFGQVAEYVMMLLRQLFKHNCSIFWSIYVCFLMFFHKIKCSLSFIGLNKSLIIIFPAIHPKKTSHASFRRFLRFLDLMCYFLRRRSIRQAA